MKRLFPWLAAMLSAAFFVALPGQADCQQSFQGTWGTTYGQMQLSQSGDHVSGTYSLGSGSTINGTMQGQRLVFDYVEPKARGKGWFVESPDGKSFTGQWLQDGSSEWRNWTGRRLTKLDAALDQFVASDAKNWSFNRYDSGSMHNGHVVSRNGDASVLAGDYSFNGGTSGWVRVHMAGDKLQCIEFWDDPNCRALGHPISQAVVLGLVASALAGDSPSSGSQFDANAEINVHKAQEEYLRQQQDAAFPDR